MSVFLLAGLVALAACSADEPAAGADRPLGPPPPPASVPTQAEPAETAPAPPQPGQSQPSQPQPAWPAPEPVLQSAEVVVVDDTGRDHAFDSNQWNAAVGVGGGAGGKYGGRAGGRREPSYESYAELTPSGFLLAAAAPRSTFAADVDTASFHNVARMLAEGRLPPANAVRLEEFVNALRYGGPEPVGNEPFALHAEVTPCPWQPEHRLARLSLRTRAIEAARVPPCNLVFLVDVSGSMRGAAKLPLLVRAMGLLVDQLRPQDRVSIVTYASGVEVVADGVPGSDRAALHGVLQGLQARGSTNGEGGIQRAYELARRHRVTGVNRVLLATDGDFNVGIAAPAALEQFIVQQKQDGVFLTVLGFGGGNLKDDRLETLADRGDGVYAYVDGIETARRVLVEQFGATLMTVAKDVKLQVEFEPHRVAGYRLLGYENRTLAAADFRDDGKDGGELGAGHAVTALYQIVPRGLPVPGSDDDRPAAADAATAGDGGPLLHLHVRYKPPHGDRSREQVHAVADRGSPPSPDQRLAAAAAGLAMLLRGDDHAGALGWAGLQRLLEGVAGDDAEALRRLIAAAAAIAAPATADVAK